MQLPATNSPSIGVAVVVERLQLRVALEPAHHTSMPASSK